MNQMMWVYYSDGRALLVSREEGGNRLDKDPDCSDTPATFDGGSGDSTAAFGTRTDSDPEQAEATPLLDALAKLETSDDSHWTNAGLPAVAIVEGFLGEDTTRDAITEAAPNLTRAAAIEAAAAT